MHAHDLCRCAYCIHVLSALSSYDISWDSQETGNAGRGLEDGEEACLTCRERNGEMESRANRKEQS